MKTNTTEIYETNLGTLYLFYDDKGLKARLNDETEVRLLGDLLTLDIEALAVQLSELTLKIN